MPRKRQGIKSTKGVVQRPPAKPPIKRKPPVIKDPKTDKPPVVRDGLRRATGGQAPPLQPKQRKPPKASEIAGQRTAPEGTLPLDARGLEIIHGPFWANSTWVTWLAFGSGGLIVEFRDGRRVEYPNTEEDMYFRMRDSHSKGRFVWRVLYNRDYVILN